MSKATDLTIEVTAKTTIDRESMESGKRDPEYHSAVYMSTLAHKPMHGEVWYRRVL